MKPILRLIPAALALFGIVLSAKADDIDIDGAKYRVDTLIERSLGPGTLYRRLRIPDYPLNINMIEVDMTNPCVTVETTQANEALFGTERLVDAANRQSSPGHMAIGGANANFWCVSQSYPYSDLLLGTTFNANLRNGKILTETNCHADQWDNGPGQIGELGITPDGMVYSDHFRWYGEIVSEATGTLEIHGANKITRDNELVMYNSYYGTDRTFKCADQVWLDGSGRWGFNIVTGQATEVRLKMAENTSWSAGQPMTFTVADVTTNAGAGTLGDYDLALVARGDRATAISALKPGDAVTLRYTWTTMDGTPIEFANMIGGNGQVMIDGQLTDICQRSENCALVYSKTGYGASADHKKLYLIVIDKSTDQTYGGSAGCTSAVMCQIARHYGCANLTNVDSGGSAQLYAMGRIVNTTTENNPRAVANGMLVYSTAPADDEITSIAFDDFTLRAPVCASLTPRILGYNRYGALVTDDLQGFTLSCDAEVGTTEGSTLIAAAYPAEGTLTATYGNATASKHISIINAELALRLHDIYIDDNFTYKVELSSTVDGVTYAYDPALASWTISDESEAGVCTISPEGILKGKTEGTATLTAQLAQFTDQATIHVETTASDIIQLNDAQATTPVNWTLTRTGINPASIQTCDSPVNGLKIDYKVTSTRGTKLTMANDLRIHALPICIALEFIPDENTTISQIGLTLQANDGSRPVTVTSDAKFGVDGNINLNFYLDEFFDTKDIAIYPITIKNIQIIPAAKTGQFSVRMAPVTVIYPAKGAVDDILIDNPANAGTTDGSTHWYDLRGIRIASDLNNAPSGIYIIRKGNTAAKVIKR